MYRRVLVFLVMLPLGGCISMPHYIPLDTAAPNRPTEITALTFIPQDEIVVTAQSAGVAQAAGGGLLMALIDSSIAKGRQEKIQAAIEPFYAAVDDVDFRAQYWSAIGSYLKQSFPLKVADVKTTPLVMTRDEHEKQLAALPASKAFMLIGTRYSFTPDFTRLEVITGIDVWRGGGKSEPIYSNLFRYQSSAVGNGDDSMKLWSENSGKLYRAAIKEGVAETVKMLDLDMRYPQLNKDQKSGRQMSTAKYVQAPSALQVTGPALDEQPARIVLRHSDGRLYSLPR